MTRLREHLSARSSLSGPEWFLLTVFVGLGTLLVFVVPLGAGNDEESQVARVWELSAWDFLPNEKLGTAGSPYPMLLRKVSYRRQLLIRPVPLDFWSVYAGLPIDGEGYDYGPVETRIVYSPPLLLPQALVMRYLGRKYELPFLAVYYAMRLAGLLTYTLLAWLAVRLIPFGKWTLAVLAASPLALFQASTLTADAISNGIGVFFVGASLAICLRREVHGRGLLGLLLLLAVLFVAKVNLIGLAILPFLALRPSSFRRPSAYLILALGALLLVAVEVGGWSLVAYPRVRTAMMVGADPMAQVRHILQDPLGFAWLIVSDAWRNGPAYLRAWIAGYGYDYWYVPAPAYLFYLFAVLASVVGGSGPGAVGRRTRLALAGTFCATYLVTALAFYVAFSPAGASAISGMHGRYLFAGMIPLVVAFVGFPSASRPARPWVIATCTALGLATFVAGAALSYYVPCGTQAYRVGLCYQPYYKNWAPGERLSPPLHRGAELIQEVVPECAGVTEFRVWVSAPNRNSTGTTSFIVRDPARDVNLAEATIPNSNLSMNGWQTLRFPPQWDSEGRMYLFKIRGISELGARVSYTAVQENPSVKLFENGVGSEADLFYQYGCLTGLERALRSAQP